MYIFHKSLNLIKFIISQKPKFERDLNNLCFAILLEMKIQLPLENWADLLPFVPRRQLVALLFQLGDYQFASILQYCLNEDGRITLGHLRILAPKANYAINGPIVELWKMSRWNYLTPVLETTLPDGPIPTNVHNLNSLAFSYFDSSVLNFLQKFHQHQNALLANMNLSIHSLPQVERQPIMAQILRLIGDNINSIELDHHGWLGYSRLLNNVQCSGNNEEFSELMTNLLTKTRILSIRNVNYPNNYDWYCHWLYAPRMDGWPRMLKIYLSRERQGLDFIDLIKNDFLMAKHPVTFFTLIQTYYYLELEDICLENGETNENLLVVNKLCGVFLISRFPMASNSEWVQANGQEILEFEQFRHDRTIYLDIDNTRDPYTFVH